MKSKHWKQALILIACLLSTTQALGQDLNRLELGTHDLVEVRTLTGITLVVDPTKIIMAYALPPPSGRGAAITNIVGLAGGPQEVDEPANDLLDRLGLKPYFVTLTLPDGVSVWIKASAISFFRATETWDHTRSEAKSAVNVAGRPIFVKETVPTIRNAINALRRQNRRRDGPD